MNGYETVREAAASVRAAFKSKGWTSRQVSVRAESFSMGSAINVTLKDGSIPLHLVTSVAKGKEKIHRDASGEILSGGNRYVSVAVTAQAAAVKARRYIEAVEKAISVLNHPPDGVLQPIIKGYYVGQDRSYPGSIQLWGDSFITQCQRPADIAYHLALHVEEHGKSGGDN